MSTSTFFIALLAIGARTITASPVSNLADLQSRQNYPLTSGFIPEDEFINKYGTKSWCCDGNTNCVTSFSQAPNGQYYQACFTPGTQVFTSDDLAAANCLTNLHAAQTDTCIDIAGSVCNFYNGRIQNMQIQDGNLGPKGGDGGGQQITALDAQTMQAAWASFVGQSMETDKAVEDLNQAPEVYVVAADLHKRAGGIGFLRYIGSDDC